MTIEENDVYDPERKELSTLLELFGAEQTATHPPSF
jgi:hypothetical protein